MLARISFAIFVTILGFVGQTAPALGKDSQYVAVLLSTHDGAPSPQAVIDSLPPLSPPGNAILHAFSVVPPDGAAYFLPVRATGDFLEYLNANPESARAELERYLLIRYSADTIIQDAEASLRADKFVVAAAASRVDDFSSVTLSGFGFANDPAQSQWTQYGRDALNTAAAWQLAGGYALVGDADSGLYVEHPALRQFSGGGEYVGGNFIPAASFDVGNWPNLFRLDVDELAPEPVTPGSACSPNGETSMPLSYAGHGTHTAGLIAANQDSGVGVSGICRHCGIAMVRISQGACFGAGDFRAKITNVAEAQAVTMLADSGVQVVNMSFGGIRTPPDFCPSNPKDAWCLAILHASDRDVAMVAASGNERTTLQFPAPDKHVIGVGGFSNEGQIAFDDPGYAFWDESPGSIDACPNGLTSQECGSNYTLSQSDPKQELVGAAHAVLSLTYPGKDWSPLLKCGNSFGPGGGTGLCTGTSMSAPQISGLAGILRSINPLVPTSKPILAFGDVPGIRTVLAQTTVQAQTGQPWSPKFGYGRPDAAAAVARTLGQVEGHPVRNRVTPLFRFYGSVSKDYLDTTTPQMAIAFSINQAANYAPQGALVPGYSSFPTEPNKPALPTPRASVYVLTTEYTPRPQWPALVPLYMVERTRNFPVGCASGDPGCNSNNRDFTLVTMKAHVEKAHADGYSLRAIQGYIYQPCSPEPACIPPGAQKFYRECKPADDDCATFLESEKIGFEAAGYTTAYPTGSSKLLGYAYPSTDIDGDGLVDGFEQVIGTRPDVADSDGDGASDGAEFPMAGLAVSDPCSGAGGGNCPADRIFWDGFQ